jgi:hypothetical protein
MGLLECDDGNMNSGDGCSASCKVEPGWRCGGGTRTKPDSCTEVCGDGLNLGRYQCDDGNSKYGDG